jgi:transcriptional antiterminator RfaH
MYWHLVHTKPKQENSALTNLAQQGYQCYLPRCKSEKLRQGKLVVVSEPLFPRYLFIKLGGKSPSPIRYTKGVCQLVTFGNQPALVTEQLITQIRNQECQASSSPLPLFKAGDTIQLINSPLQGFEGIYLCRNSDQRAHILIHFLNQQVSTLISPSKIMKSSY